MPSTYDPQSESLTTVHHQATCRPPTDPAMVALCDEVTLLRRKVRKLEDALHRAGLPLPYKTTSFSDGL